LGFSSHAATHKKARYTFSIASKFDAPFVSSTLRKGGFSPESQGSGLFSCLLEVGETGALAALYMIPRSFHRPAARDALPSPCRPNPPPDRLRPSA
jgi:hypothetical protein